MIETHWVVRLHRKLRRILPHELRQRMSQEMDRTLILRLEQEGGGLKSVRVLLSETADLLRAAVTTRRTPRSTGSRHVTTPRPRLFAVTAETAAIAARSLRRSPGITAFVVVTIGLCVGGSTAVLSSVDQILLRPYPYDDADRMATLWRRLGTGGRLLQPTDEMVEAWRAETSLFEEIEQTVTWRPILTESGTPRTVSVVRTSPTFFDFLDVDPLLGRMWDREEAARAERVVVVPEEFWSSAFGRDPSVLGQTIRLDGEGWTIIGVVPKGLSVPGSFTQGAVFWAPLAPDQSAPSVLAKLPVGLDEEVARTRLDEVSARLESAGVGGGDVGLTGVLMPIRQMRSRPYGLTLHILSGAVGLLALIACANLSNLLLWRGISRRREAAVRVSIGAGRARLILEHLMESAWLALLGGGLGLALGWGLIVLNERMRGSVSFLPPVELQWTGAAMAFGVAAVIAALVNLLPALRAARQDPGSLLRSGTRSGRSRADRRFGWTLVAAEIALSFALVVTAGLLTQTVYRLNTQSVGFEMDGLVSARIQLPSWRYGTDADRRAVREQMYERARAIPGVEHVSISGGMPPAVGIFFGQFEAEGIEPEGDGVEVFFGSGVDAAYFETLGQPILSGRGFLPEEIADDAPVVIVSETLARSRWPDGTSPIGTRLRMGEDNPWWTVVGVVSDIRAQGYGEEDPSGQMYTPAGYFADAHLIVRTAGSETAISEAMVDMVRAIDPEILIEGAGSAEARFASTIGRQRALMWMLVGFSGIALFLAVLGLYGVLAQVVGSRTREIGIRRTLGAQHKSVMEMILVQALVVGVVGIGVGVAIAALSGRWVESQLFGVDARDPISYVGTALVLIACVAVAAVRPTRRALAVDPIETLRAE